MFYGYAVLQLCGEAVIQCLVNSEVVISET